MRCLTLFSEIVNKVWEKKIFFFTCQKKCSKPDHKVKTPIKSRVYEQIYVSKYLNIECFGNVFSTCGNNLFQ